MSILPSAAPGYIGLTSHVFWFHESLDRLNADRGHHMPSGKNYKRDYTQETRTAKKRGETGAGSKSGDATRHRARRKVTNSRGKTAVAGKDVDHKRPIRSGGGNSASNLQVRNKSANRAAGGRSGNRSGKAKK